MIVDPVQTQRALLTWQSPPGGGGSRLRRAVGVLVAYGSSARFAYLHERDDFRAARQEGFEGYPGLPLGSSGYNDALKLLRRRLPQADRSDFRNFLETFGLSPGARFNDLSPLAYTGARLASDSFSITETFDGFDRPFNFFFDVAGFRHYLANAVDVGVRDEVSLVADTENSHDRSAVRIVRENGQPLGFINRLQSERVLGWMRSDAITTSVFRLNGRPEYPRLFVFARFQPKHLADAA